MNRTGWLFESFDRIRKFQGTALDQLGLGPHESDYRIIYTRPGVRVRHYGPEPGQEMASETAAPALLIVPAPIKQAYIWDLIPDRSVVCRALDHGFAVYMLEWAVPDAQTTAWGLEDYTDSMLADCMDAVALHAGAERIFLAGHSLGGIFAALQGTCRPQKIAGLILIEAPLHFAEATGEFNKLFKLGVSVDSVIPASECIPGSLLGMISATASPQAFLLDRYLDYMASQGNRADMETHWRVERWTLDEMPLPRKLFDDIAVQLYRDDKFMRGELQFGATALHPGAATAPLFTVYDPSSRIIPAESILDFYHAAGSREKALMPYLGDTGVALQHVGVLVGASAHREIWPRVFDWMHRVDAQGR